MNLFSKAKIMLKVVLLRVMPIGYKQVKDRQVNLRLTKNEDWQVQLIFLHFISVMRYRVD